MWVNSHHSPQELTRVGHYWNYAVTSVSESAGGRFANWWLPKNDELHVLFVNKGLVVGLKTSASRFNSCASEYTSRHAWCPEHRPENYN
jgi:hypothetical protein